MSTGEGAGGVSGEREAEKSMSTVEGAGGVSEECEAEESMSTVEGAGGVGGVMKQEATVFAAGGASGKRKKKVEWVDKLEVTEEDFGRFIVDVYNDEQDASLEFVQVLKIKEVINMGYFIHITVEVVEAGKKRVYDGKIFARPARNFVEVMEFNPAPAKLPCPPLP